jgi:hypothetical protein
MLFISIMDECPVKNISYFFVNYLNSFLSFILMPPSAVKTIRDTIFWQYAKLISKSAGLGIEARAFQMSTFKKLQSGEMKWSSTVREWLREHERPDECIYCGAKSKLTTEHILPKSCGGPDTPDNVIRVCTSCNSKKSSKRLYEWNGLENKDSINRIAEGKYLKLLYDLHEQAGTLDISQDNLMIKLCPKCNMKHLCQKAGKEYKLSVYCIEGLFH